jgi:phosphoglucosamine mutase
MRLFGTNGVRGVVNEDMTAEFAMKMGIAIGRFMNGTVAIASDTRVSADMILSAVSAGLMSTGCNILNLGVVPTPALQYFVKNNSLKGGVMITASHNPPKFNGIKCVSFDGTEMARKDEERIEELFFDPVNEPADIGTMKKVSGAAEDYISGVIKAVDAEAIRNAKLTVVLDCANGAAFRSSPLLMKLLGVKAITLNADPQGEFPGHLSEPTEDNLKDLVSMMKNSDADLGIAHDGDADRTVFVSDTGQYVIGDKSLALLALSELRKKKGIIVTPVNASSAVEDVVKKEGGTVTYTAVGSPTVAREMMRSGAIFGGEENGGLIFPEHQFCRDGAMSAAKMLECIVKHGKLSEQLATLPVYYTKKIKFECPDDKKQRLLEALESSITLEKNTIDGLKIVFKDGWVSMRPSGTEPIFRIYSESKDEAKAEERVEKFRTMALELLAKL